MSKTNNFGSDSEESDSEEVSTDAETPPEESTDEDPAGAPAAEEGPTGSEQAAEAAPTQTPAADGGPDPPQMPPVLPEPSETDGSAEAPAPTPPGTPAETDMEPPADEQDAPDDPVVPPTMACGGLGEACCDEGSELCTCIAELLACGTCVNPKNDASNCGACGWSCDQGACSDGACEAYVYAAADYVHHPDWSARTTRSLRASCWAARPSISALGRAWWRVAVTPTRFSEAER